MTTQETTLNGEMQPSWKLLLGIIDRPTATFKAVLARRIWWTWALPLLVLLLCFVVMTVVSTPYTLELARQQAERQLQTMPPEQAEAARATMSTFVSLPFIMATGLGIGALMLVLGTVAQAAILYFGALVAGGEVEFGPVFTVSTWTRLPLAIGMLVRAAFTAFAGRLVQYPGLATLVATGDLSTDGRNPLVALLGQLELFWLWHLVLVALGVAVVARFSRTKAVVITLIYAVISLAAVAIPSLLFGGFSGG